MLQARTPVCLKPTRVQHSFQPAPYVLILHLNTTVSQPAGRPPLPLAALLEAYPANPYNPSATPAWQQLLLFTDSLYLQANVTLPELPAAGAQNPARLHALDAEPQGSCPAPSMRQHFAGKQAQARTALLTPCSLIGLHAHADGV